MIKTTSITRASVTELKLANNFLEVERIIIDTCMDLAGARYTGILKLKGEHDKAALRLENMTYHFKNVATALFNRTPERLQNCRMGKLYISKLN